MTTYTTLSISRDVHWRPSSLGRKGQSFKDILKMLPEALKGVAEPSRIPSQCGSDGRRVPRNFRILTIRGQRVVHDEVRGHLYAWLRNGPYWKAGRDFRWPGRPAGVGLNGSILRYAAARRLKLRIFIGYFDRAYQADPNQWLEFARRYGAIYYANGVPIHLLQWSTEHFETVRDDPALAVAGELLQEGGK